MNAKDDLDLQEVYAAAPPEPSRSEAAREAHEEISVFQNIARVAIGAAVESIAEGQPIMWSRFVTEAVSHRYISKLDELEAFLKAKTVATKKVKR